MTYRVTEHHLSYSVLCGHISFQYGGWARCIDARRSLYVQIEIEIIPDDKGYDDLVWLPLTEKWTSLQMATPRCRTDDNYG